MKFVEKNIESVNSADGGVYKSPPKSIGIVSRYDNENAINIAQEIFQHLSHISGICVKVEPHTAKQFIGNTIECESSSIKNMNVDAIIAIGGDGTILRTIQAMAEPVPVLGINAGTLGFLADVDPADAMHAIDSMLKGMKINQRFRLEVTINDEVMPYATNEVVIITAHPAKILTYLVHIDGCRLDELRADAIVIATPTGSTAYAMSAGGPIVDPRVDATVIVPLAPFKLSSRPWVVPASSEIGIELEVPKKEALIVVDGQYTRTIREEDRILIKKAEKPALFIRSNANGFYENVRNKLE
ncbi:MAG: NAD(+)/NADH kinase [Methanosarcinales archaeon]|nr:NAD(+)/NADH kinase [Methanosarcinales archaeon]